MVVSEQPSVEKHLTIVGGVEAVAMVVEAMVVARELHLRVAWAC